MVYTVTRLEGFDNKRMKVTLDYGEVTFLLYKGECEKLGITEGAELDEAGYSHLMDEVLLPRAKKRTLYYMKNADKTRYEIERKLREGLYPGPVIEGVMAFLDSYGFADDLRYADNYIEEMKRTRSRCDIEARLRARGISGDGVSELLSSVTEEDELASCTRLADRRYPSGISEGDRPRAYAYLAGKGYGSAIIKQVLNGYRGEPAAIKSRV